ncbi:MAG: transposase [Acidobacteriaceae bacterium]
MRQLGSGALQAMDRCRPNLERVESVLVDGGLHRPALRRWRKGPPESHRSGVKRNELHTSAVLPKRWVVERSFGWLERFPSHCRPSRQCLNQA